MLHHRFVGILKMRRSIESLDLRIDASKRAVLESCDELKRLRYDGF